MSNIMTTEFPLPSNMYQVRRTTLNNIIIYDPDRGNKIGKSKNWENMK